jgi:hypothetical protein
MRRRHTRRRRIHRRRHQLSAARIERHLIQHRRYAYVTSKLGHDAAQRMGALLWNAQ